MKEVIKNQNKMKTKSKKSISSLKKQKVDGKKVKGGNILAGHLDGPSAEGLHAGNAHNVSSADSHSASAGHFSGRPGQNRPNAGKFIPKPGN